AAELSGTDRCPVARVRAGVAQAKALATCNLAVEKVQVPAQLPTRTWAPPVRLLPVDARLPDDLKRLRRTVDDDADLFTRGARGWRLGYPRCGLGGSSGPTRQSIGEVEHCRNLYSSSGFAVVTISCVARRQGRSVAVCWS